MDWRRSNPIVADLLAPPEAMLMEGTNQMNSGRATILTFPDLYQGTGKLVPKDASATVGALAAGARAID
jgi:hypothetical protein